MTEAGAAVLAQLTSSDPAFWLRAEKDYRDGKEAGRVETVVEGMPEGW